MTGITSLLHSPTLPGPKDPKEGLWLANAWFRRFKVHYAVMRQKTGPSILTTGACVKGDGNSTPMFVQVSPNVIGIIRSKPEDCRIVLDQ